MIVIGIFLLLLIPWMMFGVMLWNAVAGPFLHHARAPRRKPSVSVLVPARNEEQNILGCLQSLRQQEWPFLEILVLDDRSSDRTASIVRDIARQDRRVRLIAGKPLPDGWTGKNHACYQLAGEARGDLLIFTDADVRHAPTAVKRTVGWMERHQLDMASVFPQQITKTAAEKLVVSTVDLLLYALLPLWLTLKTPFVTMAAANGQWIAFRREAYQQVGGHAAVRDRVVEDVELSRLMKRHGRRILTGAGTGEVFTRMYRGAREVRAGYRKNLFGLFGKSVPAHLAATLFLLTGGVLPVVLLFFKRIRLVGMGMYVGTMLMRYVQGRYLAYPKLTPLFLHPLAVLSTLLIGWESFRGSRRGDIQWKGRRLTQSTRVG
ncbi:glycosyltransferase [bacterium]|nr:glycosyltransferase [bacterium]